MPIIFMFLAIKIGESGNHDKLINEKGIYKQLWDIQTEKSNK